MPGQAAGSDFSFIVGDETTYGTPDATTGVRVRTTGLTGQGATQNLLEDPTLDNDRAPGQPLYGNVDVSRGIPMTVAPEDMDKLLKYALGAANVYRPALVAAPQITGIDAMYAETATPLGDGTLTFTFAASTLAWQANGDTAGAAVDVSAGGTFTLESGTADRALIVEVDAGALPGVNKSDTVAIVGAYEKHFSIGPLVGSFWAEGDLGANITKRYALHTGLRISELVLSTPQEGALTAQFSVKGRDETYNTTPTDAAPDSPGHTSLSAANITGLEEGGATIAGLASLEFKLANNLDESAYEIDPTGSGSKRGDLPAGNATVMGSVTALFKNTDILDKAIAKTISSLRQVAKHGTGDGTAGNGYFAIECGQVLWERAGVPVDGPAGIRQTLNYRGFGSKAIRIITRNQVAAA